MKEEAHTKYQSQIKTFRADLLHLPLFVQKQAPQVPLY